MTMGDSALLRVLLKNRDERIAELEEELAALRRLHDAERQAWERAERRAAEREARNLNEH